MAQDSAQNGVNRYEVGSGEDKSKFFVEDFYYDENLVNSDCKCFVECALHAPCPPSQVCKEKLSGQAKNRGGKIPVLSSSKTYIVFPKDEPVRPTTAPAPGSRKRKHVRLPRVTKSSHASLNSGRSKRECELQLIRRTPEPVPTWSLRARRAKSESGTFSVNDFRPASEEKPSDESLKTIILEFITEWREKQKVIEDKFGTLRKFEACAWLIDVDEISQKSVAETDSDNGEVVGTLKGIVNEFTETSARFLRLQEEIFVRLNLQAAAYGDPESEILRREFREIQHVITSTFKEQRSNILEILHKFQGADDENREVVRKIAELEDKAVICDKIIDDLNQSIELSRKKAEENIQEVKRSYEEKIKKISETLKREKKISTELLKKTRNQNTKISYIEKTSETTIQDLQDKNAELTEKVKRLQVVLKQKDHERLKYKEELRNLEASFDEHVRMVQKMEFNEKTEQDDKHQQTEEDPYAELIVKLQLEKIQASTAAQELQEEIEKLQEALSGETKAHNETKLEVQALKQEQQMGALNKWVQGCTIM